MSPTPSTIEKAGGILARLVHGVPYIYVIHRHRHNDWSLPKGHIDSGETAEHAAVREVEEETGMRGRIVQELPDYTYTLPDGAESHVAMFLLQMEAVTGNIDTTEVDHGRWMTLEEAEQTMSYAVLREYLSTHHHQITDAILRA